MHATNVKRGKIHCNMFLLSAYWPHHPGLRDGLSLYVKIASLPEQLLHQYSLI